MYKISKIGRAQGGGKKGFKNLLSQENVDAGKNETETTQICFISISLRLSVAQMYALCCYNFCFCLGR